MITKTNEPRFPDSSSPCSAFAPSQGMPRPFRHLVALSIERTAWICRHLSLETPRRGVLYSPLESGTPGMCDAAPEFLPVRQTGRDRSTTTYSINLLPTLYGTWSPSDSSLSAILYIAGCNVSSAIADIIKHPSFVGFRGENQKQTTCACDSAEFPNTWCCRGGQAP
jgi:hypothetical protein